MLKRKGDKPTRQKPLRLCLGVVIVGLQWLIRFDVSIVAPEVVLKFETPNEYSEGEFGCKEWLLEKC